MADFAADAIAVVEPVEQSVSIKQRVAETRRVVDPVDVAAFRPAYLIELQGGALPPTPPDNARIRNVGDFGPGWNLG